MGSLFFEGLLLQASLIFALGAQNIFVLEAGLNRQHHIMVSFVCFVCDLCLILLGVAGAATLFGQFPFLKIMIGVLGSVFLFTYGFGKIMSPAQSVVSNQNALDKTLKRSIMLSITFSVFNPHAYLDAFILIGGFASKYELLTDRITFGFGAAFYSGVWFLVLSSLSSFLKPHLENPWLMRKVMSATGCILIYLSFSLGLDVFSWIKFQGIDVLSVNHWIHYPLPPGSLFTSILY